MCSWTLRSLPRRLIPFLVLSLVFGQFCGDPFGGRCFLTTSEPQWAPFEVQQLLEHQVDPILEVHLHLIFEGDWTIAKHCPWDMPSFAKNALHLFVEIHCLQSLRVAIGFELIGGIVGLVMDPIQVLLNFCSEGSPSRVRVFIFKLSADSSCSR